MKKRKEKLIAIGLAAVIAAAGTACGQTESAPAEQSASSADDMETVAEQPASAAENTETSRSVGGRIIGINNWYTGVYALDILVNNASYATETNGDTCQEYNDEANAEKLISNLENMVSSGVDGIMWMGMFENSLAVGPSIAENAKIPFALYDKISTNEEVKQRTREMEYFAGGVTCDNYEAGASMAEAAISDGCTKALLAGAEIGDPNTDARMAGFTETFENAGGKVLSVTRVSSGEANGPQQACDNMIAAYPDADCMYGSGQDYTLAALNVAAKQEAGSIRVYGTDMGPMLLEYMESGALSACCGANWTNSLYAGIMLENALDGKKMLAEDGLPAIIEDAKFISVPGSCSELYERFFVNENPYEKEEIEALLYSHNPDVELADLEEVVQAFSFEERMAAKLRAGKVTEEELKEAGVDVSAYME